MNNSAKSEDFKLIVSRRFFEKVRESDIAVCALQANLDSVMSFLRLSGIDYERPWVQTSYVDKLPQTLDQLHELQAQYTQELGFWANMQADAEMVLQNLSAVHAAVLRLYYLKGWTWEQVAKELHFSRRQTKRIADSALCASYEFLDEEAKRDLPNAAA